MRPFGAHAGNVWRAPGVVVGADVVVGRGVVVGPASRQVPTLSVSKEAHAV